MYKKVFFKNQAFFFRVELLWGALGGCITYIFLNLEVIGSRFSKELSAENCRSRHPRCSKIGLKLLLVGRPRAPIGALPPICPWGLAQGHPGLPRETKLKNTQHCGFCGKICFYTVLPFGNPLETNLTQNFPKDPTVPPL